MDAIKNILLKAAYALAGMVVTWLLALAAFVPEPGGSAIDRIIFALVAAVAAGIAAQIKRWLEKKRAVGGNLAFSRPVDQPEKKEK